MAKRFRLIACAVLKHELTTLSKLCESDIDARFLDQNLHDSPAALRAALQAEIDGTPASCDAVLLGYGLCSNALVGLNSPSHRLVVARGHDCITLLLGSARRYREYFDAHPGTYWYTRGWMEETEMPGEARVARLRAKYAEAYGEDNADYLMEMEQQWLSKYDRAAFISSPDTGADVASHLEAEARRAAEYLEWHFDRVAGDPALMLDLLSGRWNEQDFLVIEPGESIGPCYTEGLIQAMPTGVSPCD